MTSFRITLLSKGAASEEIVDAGDVTEHLRHIGLEWKQADYFHDKKVVIVVEPYADEDAELVSLRTKLAAVESAVAS